MTDLILRADKFAKNAHAGQVRKYTNVPYVMHPRSVAFLVSLVPDHTTEMIAAALLHDVVEDTPITLDEIEAEFGKEVRDLVYWLTDQSKPEDGNRKARKAIDRDHIAKAPAQAQTIKVADLIDNSSSIVQYDPDFARVYMREKEALLDVLVNADPSLLRIARTIISDYKKRKD